MAMFKRPMGAPLQQLRNARMRVQTKGKMARAQLVLPDGRKFQAIIKASPEDLAGHADELGGKFGRRFKRRLKKTVLAPLKVAHKYTHEVGPIAKLHKMVQDGVGKALPFTKPFINIHNSLAKPVHKVVAGKKVKKALTAKVIADVTKNLPAVQKASVQQALVAKVKQDDSLMEFAKKAAKAKVVTAAAKALKKNPANKAAAKVLASAKPPKGFWRVQSPEGKFTNVPASKVG